MDHEFTSLYERLSHDDVLQGESNSISKQKAMLADYAGKDDFTGIRHFTDDGISGTTFDQEGLRAVFAKVEKGNIGTIIVKDMSRLGRNYVQMGTTVTVYMRDRAVMRKLDKLMADYLDTYKLINQTHIDKTYSMPKSYVTYRKPRNLSESQREKEQMKHINFNEN